MAGPTTDDARLFGRSAVGGTLMGLANLVPGISGGTMLLAAGVYPDFINGIAEVTTLRFKRRSVIALAGIVVAAATAILLLAGVVKGLVVDHRWVMYSLFIGLTLGGVPIVRRLLGPMKPSAYGGAILGFLGMAALALFQSTGAGAAASGSAGMGLMFVAGVAGASAMILPGVSGGYLLLVLGVYVPILGGIDRFKDALKAADVGAMIAPATEVVLPVGVGVVVGIVLVSNAIKVFLDRWPTFTLGTLLGLLVGAVVGLYPFQQGVIPAIGDVVKGAPLTAQTLAELDPEDWPVEFFTPEPTHVVGAVVLVIVGFGITMGVARLGGSEESG